MILTTTNSIEGFKIAEYKGIVTGVSANKEKIVMSFSISKYYKSLQDSIDKVKEEAFQALVENAIKLKVQRSNLNAEVFIAISKRTSKNIFDWRLFYNAWFTPASTKIAFP